MACYCIGDVHGCYDEFMQLLDKMKFDERKDELYLTGDLIGRGPKPLETMKFILAHRDIIHPVLGNHDLNFLAVLEGERQARPKDNLGPMMQSDMIDEIRSYLLSLPLIEFCKEKQFAVCHAGIHPLWDLRTAKTLSKEVCRILRDPLRRPLLLRNMYRDYPAAFDENCEGMVRWRYAINVFTRMRLMTRDLNLDYGNSSTTVEDARKEGLFPWFEFVPAPKYKKKDYRLVFGHWAALNAKCPRQDIVALDTGCVWGGEMTGWNASSDKRVSVPSQGHLKPKA